MSTKKRFSSYMNACNVISALLVVFIHAYNVDVYNNVSNSAIYWFEQIISECIARGAVPFFFISSAFFLYSSKKSVTKIYSSRFRSVVVPYLLWNIIYMIAFALLHYLSFTNVGMDKLTFSNLFGGIFLHKYNYTYWFMKMLIIYIIMYPVIRWIISRGKIVSVIFGILFLTLYCIWTKQFEATKINTFIYYYIGAVAGFHYKEQTENLVSMPQKRKIILLGVVSLLGILFFVATNVFLLNLALIRDFIMVLFIFFTVIVFNIQIKGSLSVLSFMIYSLHPLILEIIEKTVYLFMPHTAFLMLTDYIFAPIICVAIITAICVIWKKVLPGFYKLLNGGRV